MKKQLFFALAALGMLASCSNNELLNSVENIQPEPQSIGFSGFVNKSTRTEMNLSNLEDVGFKVWGDMKNSSGEVGNVFSSQDVTHNTAWEYSPLRYWIPGNAYAFTAVAPKGNTAWVYTHKVPTQATDFLTKRHGEITFTQPSDANKGAVDLILASATVNSAAANQSPVSLQFNHLLSRVRFKFTNGFASSSSYVSISDVKFKTANSAKIDLTEYTTTAENKTLVWTSLEDECTTEHKFGDNLECSTFNRAGNSGETSAAYVIPTKGEVVVSFKAHLYTKNANNSYTDQHPGGWQHNVKLDLKDIDSKEVMVPGYSYTFVAELNEDNIGDDELTPITFTANVTGWVAYEEFPYIVFNKSSVNLTVGNTFQLLHGVDDLSVTYESTNTGVATVDTDGTITAVKAGSCQIKANATGYQETIINVTVN